MNIEGKPGANSLVRKFEWCYIPHLFLYCRWVEWVNCWYLLGFTNFPHRRSIFYRSNFEGAPKARCLFETEKWILVSQHNLMTWSSCVLKSDFQNRTSWSEICKIIYPEARFLKDYFTDKRFAVPSEGPAFTTTCLWPRIWLVSHWARLAISRLSSSLSKSSL